MLEFDEAKHEYTYDGLVVPNVTRVLDLLGMYAAIPEEVLDWKSQIGTAVHAATALFDASDLDEASIDPHIVGYINAWGRFRREANAKMLLIETRVYHPTHRYAGTVDRVMSIPGRGVALGEIKCTAQAHAIHKLQTAAYTAAIQAGLSGVLKKQPRRFCIYLRPNGEYRLVEHEDYRGDLATFCGMLQVYNWMKKEGKV